MTTQVATPEPITDEQRIIPKGETTTGAVGESPASLLFYLFHGAALGLLFTKAEVVSWFRIQEMFRFQSIHMFGTIGSAVIVGAISLIIIKRIGARSLNGERIVVAPKEWTPGLKRYWLGGTLFGLGWSLLGACPGPLFTLVGSGYLVVLVAIASALVGTWAYAFLRDRLPH